MSPKKKFFAISVAFILLIVISFLLYRNISAPGDKIFFDESDPSFRSPAKILLVDNVARSAGFYMRNFGFGLYKRFPLQGRPTLAVIAYKNLYVMLEDRELFGEEQRTSVYPEIPASFSLYIDVDNALEIYENLKDSVEIVQDYQLIFYGRYEFSVKDRDGYIVTVSQKDKTVPAEDSRDK